MAERLNKDTIDDRIGQQRKLILLDFYSDSCVPCKRIAPILAELEEAHAQELYVGKISIAYEEELVERYKIRTAPTLLFLKNGAEIKRLTGVVKKAELEQIIRENAT